ncbi:MAG: hypothetical protein M1827_000291 [Pycnora praestabilis]|nr:MAG: hypothetical protein M1827_000291 [Pycnora praestabilis]
MPRRMTKRLLGVFFVCALWLLYLSRAEKTQAPLANGKKRPIASDEPAKRVAIIGAGSGGASAAYYLNNFAAESGINVNITVFERSPYVGGRSTTIDVYDEPSEPVEVGASIFVNVNRNLVSAAKAFGLITEEFGGARSQDDSDKLGVWNSNEFVFTQNEDGYYWWSIAKLIWKYGWTPIRTQNLMKSTVGKFLMMYEAPHFPFRSLSDVAYNLGLTAVTAATGEQFLKENKIGPPFSTEIIQASTRVNYGQNLGLIHGLETMVCMATDGGMAIQGGNWRIFDGMLEAADAHVRLNTRVKEIHRSANRTYDIKYIRTISSLDVGRIQDEQENFDSVIIAAPLQFTDISISPALSKPLDKIPYVNLHVTLFTSPHKLSATAFNLPEGSSVPSVILTTLPPGVNYGSSENGVGPTGFFSISTLRTLTNPSTTRHEYLYKIFSPEPLDDVFLSSLLDLPAPSSTFTSATKSRIPKEDISWRHDKQWYSYPYLYPRVTFDDIQLDWNLWYTSGIESFISTMETSSLMGMNVARLVTDDWMGAVREKPELKFDRHGKEENPPLKGKKCRVGVDVDCWL